MSDIGASLGLIGSFVNSGAQKQKQVEHESISTCRNPSGNNIYDSTDIRGARKLVEQMAKQRFNKSKIPQSKIVPKNFNIHANRDTNRDVNDEDSVFSDDQSMASDDKQSRISVDMNDPTALIRRADKMSDNAQFENRVLQSGDQSNKCNTFYSQFEPMSFDNSGNPVASNNTNKSGLMQLETERDLAIQGGYSSINANTTYGIMNKDNLTHNNMVPWPRLSTGYSDRPEMEQNRVNTIQRKMELFTGSLNNVDYRPKTERRPLFNPLVGLSNIYGLPNFTDFMELRHMPGRERRDELPFQPTRVNPGMNLGYNEDSKVGFHDTYRVLPKSTNELRTANRPKIEYGNRINHGMKGIKRGVIPLVMKNRPETFKENDPKDMVKSLGYIRAPTVYGHYDNPYTKRAMHNISWFGGGAYSTTKTMPEEMLPKYRKASKEQFKHRGPGSAGGLVQKGHARDLNDIPQATLKELYEETNHVNPISGLVQKGHAWDMNNIPDPTLRDITLERSYIGGPTGQFIKKGHAWNMDDVPDPTMRDMHINQNWLNSAGGFVQKGHAYDLSDIPDPTFRDMQVHNTYTGPVGGLVKKGHAHDLTDIPDLTRRDIYIDNNWLNPAGGFIQKGHARDLNDSPDLTLRDVHSHNTYTGPIGGLVHKGHAQDLTDVPDSTLRDIHVRNTYAGPVGGLVHKGHARDLTDVPDSTLRDIHVRNTYTGPVGGLVHKGHAQDLTDMPDPTLRDIHVRNTYTGPVGGLVQKGHAQDLTDVPDPTRRDLYIDNNWLNPAGGLVQKGHARDLTDIPDPTRRDLTTNNTYLNPAGGLVHKGHAPDLTDIPDLTRKDIYINNNWLNPAGGLVQKGHARNLNDIPDPTLADIYIDNNWLNPVGGLVQKGHAWNMNDIPDPTRKDLVVNNTYIGPTGYHEKQRGRADVNSMLLNDSKEQILKGRAPTTSNYNKGPTMQFTTVNLCDPIQINRDLYPTMYGQNVSQCLPTIHTQIGNHMLPQTGWRINSHVADNLRYNPFVNNTQHKVVQF